MTSRRDNPEDVLRQAFEARAGRVEVAPDALRTIRTRVLSRRAHRRRALQLSLASLATGAAATVTAVVIGLGSCSGPPTTAPIQPGGTTKPATNSPDASATSSPGSTDRLPVYYIGIERGRPVLYREYHTLPAGDGTLGTKIRSAVTDMIAGKTLDPQYASSWPASASVRRVQISGDTIVVDLAGATVNPVDPPTAQAAVQQLIHTATGVAADQGRSDLQKVRLLFDGQPRTTLWGVNVTGTLTRGPSGTTLAQVWLSSPQQGDTVGPSFNVLIVGTVPEATTTLRIRDAGGTIVQEHTITLSIGGPGRGDAIKSITLPPGRYTLQAFYFSAADGGSIQAMDDHEITVR